MCGYYDLQASYLGYTNKNKPHFVFLDSRVDPYSVESLKASRRDPDTLSWDEAMAIPEEVGKWKEAALKEIRALKAKKTWLR